MMQQIRRAMPLALRREPNLRPSTWEDATTTRPVDELAPELLERARSSTPDADPDADLDTEEEVTATRRPPPRVSLAIPPSTSDIHVRSPTPTVLIEPEPTRTAIPSTPPRSSRSSGSSCASLPRPVTPPRSSWGTGLRAVPSMRAPSPTRPPAPARVSLDELVVVPPRLPRPLPSVPPETAQMAELPLPTPRAAAPRPATSSRRVRPLPERPSHPFAPHGRATFVMLCIAAFCAAMAVGILASTLGRIHRICGNSAITGHPRP